MTKLIYYISISIVFSSLIFSQPSRKLMERIQTIKKVKLLETLDLNEDRSEKVLIKYNTYEDKFTQKIQEFDEVESDLEEAIYDENESKIIELTKKFLEIKDQLFRINEEKDNALKEILSSEEFAKYLIFEKRFRQELSRELIKRGRRRN
jgi:hypothetical protein